MSTFQMATNEIYNVRDRVNEIYVKVHQAIQALDWIESGKVSEDKMPAAREAHRERLMDIRERLLELDS